MTAKHISPERLDLVRKRLGYTKVGFAEALNVDRKVISRFESGQYDLPDSAVHELVKLSGFPVEFFCKPEPEFPEVEEVSFRSLRALTAKRRDAALASGAIAFELDDWVSRQYDLPKAFLPTLDPNDPIASAMELRVHWGIGNRPIGNLMNLLEAKGIRVFSLVENTTKLDAYSLWRDDVPYVFLNTLKTAERTRFDAAHELGHLVMHRNGAKHSTAEMEADQFASAFLMPPDDVRSRIRFVNSIDQVIEAKKRWGVSAAALLYTLHKREARLTEWRYRGFCIELAQISRKLTEQGLSMEPDPLDRETSQIWSKILQDLWRRRISISRVCDEIKIPEAEFHCLLSGLIKSTPAAGIVSSNSSDRTLRVI